MRGASANFGGPDFNVTGTFDWAPGTLFSGSYPPNGSFTVPLVVLNAASYFRAGTLTYMGTAYSIPNPVIDPSFVNFNLIADAPIVISGTGSFWGTFTGTGTLRLKTTNNPFLPFNVDDTFTGTGHIRIDVTEFPTPPGAPFTNFNTTQITYFFGDAPEPSSWALAAAPLAAILIRHRRRRNTPASDSAA